MRQTKRGGCFCNGPKNATVAAANAPAKANAAVVAAKAVATQANGANTGVLNQVPKQIEKIDVINQRFNAQKTYIEGLTLGKINAQKRQLRYIVGEIAGEAEFDKLVKEAENKLSVETSAPKILLYKGKGTKTYTSKFHVGKGVEEKYFQIEETDVKINNGEYIIWGPCNELYSLNGDLTKLKSRYNLDSNENPTSAYPNPSSSEAIRVDKVIFGLLKNKKDLFNVSTDSSGEYVEIEVEGKKTIEGGDPNVQDLFTKRHRVRINDVIMLGGSFYRIYGPAFDLTYSISLKDLFKDCFKDTNTVGIYAAMNNDASLNISQQPLKSLTATDINMLPDFFYVQTQNDNNLTYNDKYEYTLICDNNKEKAVYITHECFNHLINNAASKEEGQAGMASFQRSQESLAGGRKKKSSSTKKNAPHSHTTRKHVDKAGVKRTIFTKNDKDYIRIKNKAGEMVYKKV